jgi:ABC-2 type transport system permease protein
LTALPLITLGAMRNVSGEFNEPPPEQFLGELCQGMSELVCTQVYMLNLFTLLFMILPVMIPVTIAAYSIVGEKTARSLEPLLATPITTVELLVAKAIAAVVPAIVATWIAYAIYLVGARLLVDDEVFRHLLDPLWLIAIFVVGPLLTLLAVNVALIVSSRVTDPRVAEQLSGVVILPLILLVVGQSVGLVLLNRQLILAIGAVVILLDAALLYLSVKTFQRETILTRWR